MNISIILGWGLLQTYGLRLLQVENSLEDVAYKKLPERLATLLVELDEEGTGIIKGAPLIRGDNPWRYSGPKKDMYQFEHDELFASIRKGEPINDGLWMAQSTLAAIMGRMAAYTGQEITWEQALNSQWKLVPDHLAWTSAAKQGVGTANTLASKVWFTLGSGIRGFTYPAAKALALSRSGLWVGGEFETAGNKPSYNFGLWHALTLAPPRFVDFRSSNSIHNRSHAVEPSAAFVFIWATP